MPNILCASAASLTFFCPEPGAPTTGETMTGAAASAAGDCGDGAQVEFRKVSLGESRLWQTRRIRHADLNRLHLRSMESILDPTVSADNIIGAYVCMIRPRYNYMFSLVLPASLIPTANWSEIK